MASKKDLLVYVDVSSGSPALAIRRRNNEGDYLLVANYTGAFGYTIKTNGNWIVSFIDGQPAALFHIDSNNTLSATSYCNVLIGYLLSDDTLVGTSDGLVIKTFAYNSTWNEIPGTALSLRSGLQWLWETASFQATDKHLTVIQQSGSDYAVEIYERLQNRSWSFVESFPVNDVGGVTYNGIDTVVFSIPGVTVGTANGIVLIYTKINGTWATQEFTTTSVGYRPLGYFGLLITFVDANSLLIAAGYEGYTGSSPTSDIQIGKVLLLTRLKSDELWDAVADMNSTGGQFGLGLGINNYDVLIANIVTDESGLQPTLTFYTTPSCFTQPIDVTCKDQQVDDCAGLVLSDFYTVNTAQCGNEVIAVLGNITLFDDHAVANITLSRSFALPVTCTAQLTCPTPPVASVVPLVDSPDTGSHSPMEVNGAHSIQLSLASLSLAAIFVHVL